MEDELVVEELEEVIEVLGIDDVCVLSDVASGSMMSSTSIVGVEVKRSVAPEESALRVTLTRASAVSLASRLWMRAERV